MTLDMFVFILLGVSILSVWFRRDPKVWGGFLILSLVIALFTGHIFWTGLLIVAGWVALWFTYAEQKGEKYRILFFAALVFLSFAFKLHLLPGFNPLKISAKFYLGLQAPLIGLLPLALLVPLAMRKSDWKVVFTKGLGLSLAGIGAMAVLAFAMGAVEFNYRLPSYPALRYLSNLVLVTIPEEAFYRGFIQRELCNFFPDTRNSKLLALVITSVLFTMAHIYWSPTLGILAFVFLASMLYGWVYLVTEKIESAILCHFLLNFVHMTFFTYHAM